MGGTSTKSIDIIYIRKIGFIGAFLLIGITLMNLFVETGTYDYPIPRVLIALSIFILALLSYRNNWVKENGLNVLYLLFFIYNFYGIALVAVNHFQAIDTSATIIIGFALCTFIKNRSVLNAYLVYLLFTYIVFFYYAEETIVSDEYFFLVLFFVLSLGYMIFNGKIDSDEKMLESKLELESSEKKFRSVFEKSPIGIMLLDMKLKAFQINQGVEKFLGYTQEEFSKLNPWDYVLEEDYMDPNELISNILKSEKINYVLDKRIITKDGEVKWARFTMAFIKNDVKHEQYIVSMIEDITFSKQAEFKLKDYSHKLEIHNKALEEFSYIISHDLQEPLRMIQSYTSLIKRRYISKLNDKDAEIDMGFVIDGAERMSSLIKAMLRYSRWSAKPFELEMVDTRDVLVEVIKNLTVGIAERDGQIYCSKMPVIPTNRVLFSQVMQNLISNGLKYYSNERAPRIIIQSEIRDFDVLFTVKDNGQGFDEKDSERIFGIFQRLHGKRSKYKGSGIGLAICKQIIEKQGGRIWAESVKGEGATFYFTLPKTQKINGESIDSRTRKRILQLQ